MGPRRGIGCGALLVLVVLAMCPEALAADIGRDPLAPPDAPPSALVARGPTQSQGAPPVQPSAEPLSARGPTLSAERPSQDLGASEPAPRRRWYGWQTLLVDGAVGVAVIAVTSGEHASSGTSWVAPVTAVYVLAPPVVHAAHGHVGKTVLSLGLRAIGPLLIFAGSNAYDSHDDSHAPNAALLILGVLSIPAAIAIDAAAIAREDVSRDHASSFFTRVGFAPWIDAKHGAGGLVLALPL
ncbi:MAG TPA: hypothetical protein VH062_22145 [Polyangiaceae bacterium]|nr:hypothetical protein [Polyangiaceae bacterium]